VENLKLGYNCCKKKKKKKKKKKNMSAMVQRASIFNRDILSWNTAIVTDRSAMFQGTSMFNVDVLD